MRIARSDMNKYYIGETDVSTSGVEISASPRLPCADALFYDESSFCKEVGFMKRKSLLLAVLLSVLVVSIAAARQAALEKAAPMTPRPIELKDILAWRSVSCGNNNPASEETSPVGIRLHFFATVIQTLASSFSASSTVKP